MKKLSVLFLVSPLVVLAAGCAAEKSSNPLSPTVAGPIPGVGISAPSAVEPAQGSRIAVGQQPITLVVENATTTGVRPLSYLFEVAADGDFNNKLFVRDNVEPGDGRTTMRIPDALPSGRTYYWRARAGDGANTGPYSNATVFDIFTPVVIDRPTLLSPINNTTLSDLAPTFRLRNAPRSGPAGEMAYEMNLAESATFAGAVTWVFPERPNESTLNSPAGLGYSKQYFWRARAYDSLDHIGPWSDIAVFSTPAAPPPPPSGGGGGGSGGQNGTGGHLPAGPPTKDRAEQIVFGTGNEYPGLLAVFPTDSQAESAAEQLMLRTIWHLQLAGFQAGRQKNPSGTISKDKLTIFIDGGWHAYDIYTLGFAGQATRITGLNEVTPANYQPNPGISD